MPPVVTIAAMTIVRRDVDLDFGKVPRDWCGGDPHTTAHLEALSLLFPEGERFFVEAVKQLRHHVRDPALAADVAGFIGQEAMHGREHRAFNDAIAPRIGRRVDRWLRGFFVNVRRVLSPHSQLAATAAVEHLTALLAEAMLGDPEVHGPIDPAVRTLWLWHGLEESEHKAVAFDVYRAAGGGYLRRAAMMALATVFFVAIVTAVQLRLRRSNSPRALLWPATYLRLVPAYLQYYLPRFHPSDRDTRALVERWRATLFPDELTTARACNP